METDLCLVGVSLKQREIAGLAECMEGTKFSLPAKRRLSGSLEAAPVWNINFRVTAGNTTR